METREKVSNDKLTRRKIQIRPNPAAKERQKHNFPQFPNFPQLYPESNSTQQLDDKTNDKNENKTETLPQAQPFTMSKSESRHRNHNNKARRKIDSIPINLTPSDPYRKSPYNYDYYDDDYDYYYDDYYEELPPPKQKLPNFRPLPTKPPPTPPKKVNYQTRKSAPKSPR